MPFITEEIWCNLTGGESLVVRLASGYASHSSQLSLRLCCRIQEVITKDSALSGNDQGIKTSAKVIARF
jgi:valyl-tRNA synthetase